MSAAWSHLSPRVPVFDHKRVSLESLLTYTLRALMCAPYMWYQKDKHFPPPALLPGTFALISFAVSFGFLGQDVSINMYHPLAKSMQKNMSELLILPPGGGGATIIQQGTTGRVKKGGEVLLPAFHCRQNFIERERERSGYEAKSFVRLQASLRLSKSLILKPYATWRYRRVFNT